jgi:hypothetical protein
VKSRKRKIRPGLGAFDCVFPGFFCEFFIGKWVFLRGKWAILRDFHRKMGVFEKKMGVFDGKMGVFVFFS